MIERGTGVPVYSTVEIPEISYCAAELYWIPTIRIRSNPQRPSKTLMTLDTRVSIKDLDPTTRGPMPVTQSTIQQLMYVLPRISNDPSNRKNLHSDQYLGEFKGNHRPGIWLRSCLRLRDHY